MGKLSTKQCIEQDQLPKSTKPNKSKKKPIKITYISSPTMFRATNASEFRSLVQELTGKDSKVLDTLDSCATSNDEAGQVVASNQTPSLKIDCDQSVDDMFSSYTSSSSLEIEDCFPWGHVTDSFFEFKSCVFV